MQDTNHTAVGELLAEMQGPGNTEHVVTTVATWLARRSTMAATAVTLGAEVEGFSTNTLTTSLREQDC